MAQDAETPIIGTPLVFIKRLTEADVGHVQFYQDLVRVSRNIRRTLSTLLGLLFALIVGASLATAELRDHAWWIAAVFCGYWSVLSFFPQLHATAARWSYRKHQAAYGETHVVLGAQWVEESAPDYRVSCQWPLVGLIGDTPHGLLFCNQAGQLMLWLPERVLNKDNLRQRVLGLAAASGVTVRRL